jgi:predicted deacylase
MFHYTVCRGEVPSHQSLHDVYLANTEHELHIYRIYGKEPGKTIMLIGGIQGDEPGGYLTADLYADISLKKGNLIVVPRANFYSILLNQRDGMTGDMNRKFANKADAEKSMEQEIVTILKKLIGEADCLLNLHEGSGFYNKVWKSEVENPDRFGQSIIYDAKSYFDKKNKSTVDLETLAKRVIGKVNPQIDNHRYHFQANNHDTVSDTTRHLEQRKSATYYALTQENIPAFGVETSKSIKSNSDKVSFQKLVINAFMDEFGIIPESPGLHIENTNLKYVLIKVNGGLPYAVPNSARLQVESGDEVIVTDIIANFDRGLTADFLGMGNHNDTNLSFRITEPTKVIIRKDAETCGWIEISVAAMAQAINSSPGDNESQEPSITAALPLSAKETRPLSELQAEQLLLNINGELVLVPEGGETTIARDKLVIIKGVRSNISRLDRDIFANLKGFSPPKAKNDGNDINFPLYPNQDLWARFSENKKGIRYPITATYNSREIGKFWINIK